MVSYPLRIYADLACPLCRAEMDGLARRDAGQRLEMVDCSGEVFRDADSAAANYDRAQLLHRIHARDADGRWLVGVPVFAAAYDAAGLTRMARLLRLRWLEPLWTRGYGFVADHRAWLVRFGLPRLLAWCLAPRSDARARPAPARAE